MIRRYIIEADDSLKGFDEAIEKLEREWGAEEIEGSEDCISRQALIEKATSWDKHFADSERYVSLTDIQGAPPVTPTRHHGDWEETVVLPRAYDIMGNKTWASQMRCNKCEFATFAVEGKFSQYNFCPNCGADMREVNDG